MTAPRRRRSIEELSEALEKYKSSGNNEFFTLQNDKETARVRILYDSAEELDWYVVHEVVIGGKKRWLMCTEEGDCPACVRNNKPQLKLFLQLEDQRDGKVKTWERGQKMIPKIMDLFNKYGPLCNRLFEIERNGKPNDTNTDYEFYALEADGKTLDQLPPKQDFLADNGFILCKSKEEMELIMEGKYQYPSVQPTTPREQVTGRSEVSGSEVF